MEGFRVGNPALNGVKQNFLIHTVKELFNVRAPDVSTGILFKEFLRTLNRTQKPLTLPARPRVVNKGFIKNRYKVIVNQAVNNAVAKLETAALKLRLLLELRLCNETKIFQVQAQMEEIGRMLGGWLRSVHNQ